ncbi:MAG: DUF1788 domain-containing protein [Deltaproteobacteria bacterium]|nr:DUF1788 domain-containing protein [Deltaproteobacteria bacterium]
MIIDKQKLTLPERFEHLKTLLKSPKFLNKQGIGNEVPFFICPYKPKEAVAFFANLLGPLVIELRNSGIRILEIDLYDLVVKTLRSRSIWDTVIQNESHYTKEQLKELLQGVLDIEKHLVPAIADRMKSEDFDIMFLTGVGEVFPYIRSHNVLNNLQKVAKEKPTVMFFPGEYTQNDETGASLDLFGRLHDDKYYRAFNIYHCDA